MPFKQIKTFYEHGNRQTIEGYNEFKLHSISKINDNYSIIIIIKCCKDNDIMYVNKKISEPLFTSLIIDYYYNKIPGLYNLEIEFLGPNNGSTLKFIFSVDTDLIEVGINKLYSIDSSLYSVNRFSIRNITLDNISFYNSLPKENSIIGIKFPQFFKYQRQNITKMLSLESDENIEISSIVDINFDDKYLKYNLNSGKYNDDNDIPLLVKTKGGILADEMGLGKTISTIGLTYFNSFTGIVGQIKDKKIVSKANLIIVPSHLSKQWESEIKKFLPDKKIIKIYTKTNHMKISYQDIIDSDYVIITQQFLLNFNYYIREGYKYVTPTTYDYNDRIVFINEQFDEWIKKNVNYHALNKPFLELFHFHRIIIDEGHEIFEKNLGNYRLNEYLLDFLNYNIHGNFRWYISGSPFTTYTGLGNCMKFIKFTFPQLNEYYDITYSGFRFPSIGTYFNYNNKTIFDKMIENITIRSLKSDITDEIKLPGYEEEYHFVELSDTERKLYDSKKIPVLNISYNNCVVIH